MVKGSCACGDWTYEFEGEPIFTVGNLSNTCAPYSQLTPNQGMCHCNWCRKTSGHNGNTFIVIMDSAVSQPAPPIIDSQTELTSHVPSSSNCQAQTQLSIAPPTLATR